MELTVDQSKAMRELRDSLVRCKREPSIDCSIKPVIDFILAGKNCLTYRYILLTALTAKSTNAMIDILSLQASDTSDGAYDARSLCSHVVFPFQRQFLEDVLDGSNEDPLVNNPGRNQRIQKSNKAAPGDPRKALDLLCEYLPTITDSGKARACLDYYLSQCLALAGAKREQTAVFSCAALTADAFSTRRFMDDLLDKNFGGSALLLVTTAVFTMLYPEAEGYKVVPHPVNQSGRSGRQMSDLDIFLNDETPFLAIELKDKPFSEVEVTKAAKAAFEHNAPSMLFIAGRSSQLTDKINRYFNEVKKQYEEKGMMIGIVSIDALMDMFFATHYRLNAPFIFTLFDKIMEGTKASPEVQRWVFGQADTL